MKKYITKLIGITSVILLLNTLPSKAEESSTVDAHKKALEKFKNYVGEWKGMGLPKGSSKKDGWGAAGQWAWKFEKDSATLEYHATKSQQISMLRLEWDAADANTIKMICQKDAEAPKEEFSGKWDDKGAFVATNPNAKKGRPSRITLELIAKNKRLLIYLESKEGTAKRYRAIAEIGMTRKGSGFGKNTTQKECVVTGGLGTTAVQHDGKTYYVCCGGCKDVFQENPDAEIAAYKKRKTAEKDAEKEKEKENK